MTWYSARLLYEFVHDPPDAKPDPLFEESLIVFRVPKAEDPINKLLHFARAGEDDYEALAGNHVYYTFREVLEVQEISGKNITDGAEVFYRLSRNPGPMRFRIMRETQTHDWWSERMPTARTRGTRAHR